MNHIPGPICLNCEKKKKIKVLITINYKSGFICDECYNAHIWANKDDRKIRQVGNLLYTQK